MLEEDGGPGGTSGNLAGSVLKMGFLDLLTLGEFIARRDKLGLINSISEIGQVASSF